MSSKNKNFFLNKKEKELISNFKVAILKIPKNAIAENLFEYHKNLKKNVSLAKLRILSVNQTANYT